MQLKIQRLWKLQVSYALGYKSTKQLFSYTVFMHNTDDVFEINLSYM